MRYQTEHFHIPHLIEPSVEEQRLLSSYRQTIESIILGHDSRRLLILGPCSVHDPKACLDYALRVRDLAIRVADTFFCVLRTYVEKPRSSMDWKGFLYDPRRDHSYDFVEGIQQSQRLMKQLCQLGIPLAAELLDPCFIPFYLPFLSWGCIGARTVTSPIHRQIASGSPCPIGFKNTVDGNVDVAIQAALAAQQPHTFLWAQSDGKVHRVHTKGNPATHIVLRGGNRGPNYMSEVIKRIGHQQQLRGLSSRICVDCSHDNSGKDPHKQSMVFNQLIEQITEGVAEIGGLMLESFLHQGKQTLDAPQYGVSVTDGCLGWKITEALILAAQATLHHHGRSDCALISR